MAAFTMAKAMAEYQCNANQTSQRRCGKRLDRKQEPQFDLKYSPSSTKMAVYFCENHRDEQASMLNKSPQAVYFRIRAAVTDMRRNKMPIKEAARKWNVKTSAVRNICSHIKFSRKFEPCQTSEQSNLTW